MNESGRRRAEAPVAGTSPQQSSWIALYEDYHEEVRSYFARYVKQPQDVDDLVQDLFAKLLVHSANLQNPGSYVRAMARHELYAYWRQKRKKLLMVQAAAFCCRDNLMVASTDGSCDFDPSVQLANREMHWILSSMVACLPTHLAEAMRLTFTLGLDLNDAASRAGCSLDAMKKRVRRAERSLKRLTDARCGQPW